MKAMLAAATVGVLLAVPPAHAQQPSRAPDPLDPGAPVPRPVYESAFAGHTRTAPEHGATPDKTWRRMNDALVPAAPHAGHGATPPASAQPTTPVAAPAAPGTPARPAPAQDGHGHHRH